jgi:hypothetical protein
MRKLSILLMIFIFVVLVISGCSLPFFQKDEGAVSPEPIKTFEVNGTVLDKPAEEEIVVATSIVTGKIKVPKEKWAETIKGQLVRVLVTTDEIVNIIDNAEDNQDISSNYVAVTTSGFNYETVGFIGDKYQNEDSCFIEVAGENVTDTINVSEEVFQMYQIGQSIKIFANLEGIKNIAELTEQEETEGLSRKFIDTFSFE